MSALETMENILSRPNLMSAGLKYCLLNKAKIPLKIDGTNVSPNKVEDFVDFNVLCIDNLSDYAGIGISIQASNICAIDVDHCFKSPFVLSSGDSRAENVLNIFKNSAYCEFSFSGTGLRVLFRHPIIENYAKMYYIKNSKNEMEFYQPGKSFRYVTLTGCSIYDNELNSCEDSILYEFLDKYMVRPRKLEIERNLSLQAETRDINQLKEVVKYHYLTNPLFQDIWFSKAPGSGKDESERDYFLISYMYTNVTKDKALLKNNRVQTRLFHCRALY